MLTFQLLGAAFLVLTFAPLFCGRGHTLTQLRRRH